MKNPPKSDIAFLQMHEELLRSSRENPLLTDLLKWVDARAIQLLPNYSPARGRAYNLALIRVVGFLLANYLDPARSVK
jgi:hypothetical protein